MNTKALRQKILDLAIHGKLVPQDPNDEPASVLLERIKAEKERLIKEGKIKRTKRSKAACDKPHYPYELPEGWCWTTLGEIGTWQSGATPSRLRKDYYGGNIPWLKTGDLNDGFITEIPESITNAALQETSVKLNPKDSVLIAMYGATIGKVGILTYPATTNQACCACTEYIVDKLYLFYFLLAYRNAFIAMGGGGAQPNISKEKIITTLMPLPPLQEQKRIVDSIGHWFSLVNSVEESKENLQEVIKQTKSKILDLAIHGKLVPQDPTDEPATELLKRINPKAEITCDNPQYGKLPNGWCLIQGKSLYKPMKSMKPKDSVFNYIDIDSINNAKQSIDSVKVVKTENAPSRASRYTQKGDIVFSMVRPYLKNIAMVPANDCIASTGFYVCSPSNVAISKYCYYLMISDYTVSGLNQFMKGDNSPSINRGDIDNWLFPLPPLSEQHRIVAKIEELFTQLDNITSSL